jgi:tetratricopeptide (TPR) repeat protein
LAPRHRDAAIGAGEVAFKLGRRDASLRSFERAREIGPDSPRVLSRLGELYLDRGDRAKAVEAWQKSLSLDPSQSALRERLAAIEPK